MNFIKSVFKHCKRKDDVAPLMFKVQWLILKVVSVKIVKLLVFTNRSKTKYQKVK